MIGVCDKCPLDVCDERDKRCRYTQITRVRERRPEVALIWQKNLEQARKVKTARRLLGFKKYDKRYKFAV